MNKFLKPTRVWINQPSTLQANHLLHGKVGLALDEKGDTEVTTIWFVDGPVFSQRIHKKSLSLKLS
jgi:hypothetical protein